MVSLSRTGPGKDRVLPKQAPEECFDPFCRPVAGELVGPETIDLVPGEPEVTIGRHHVRVPGKGRLPVLCEVVRSVNLDNHTACVAKQDRKSIRCRDKRPTQPSCASVYGS